MDHPRRASWPAFASPTALWLAISIALATVALWPLLGAEGAAGARESGLPDARDIEQLFFEPQQSAPGLIVLIAAGLLALRVPRFLACEPSPRPFAAGLAFATSLASAVWSRLVAAEDLLVFSLIFALVGFALATRGVRGARTLTPALVALLFALPIPGRLANEIIWQLQLASTDGAELLLRSLGIGLWRDGVFMRRGEAGFLVIESCSGFRSVQILTLLAIVVGELLALGRRTWLLCGLAPLIAFGLNVLRITWIVLDDQDTATAGEHVGQGMTVLIVGTACLFGLARWLAPPDALAPAAASPEADPAAPCQTAPPDADAGASSHAPPGPGAWRRLADFLVVLAVVVHATPAWPPARFAPMPLDSLFQARERWSLEALPVDRIFLGSVGLGQILHHRLEYEGSRQASPGPVDLFVGVEAVSAPRRSPVSDKLLLPAREWGLEALETHRDWRLFRDTQEAIVRREGRGMMVRLWYVNDPGPAADLLRSLLALVRGPFEPERRRVVVRMATPVPGTTPRALAIARARLDQLVMDYRDDFDRLGS